MTDSHQPDVAATDGASDRRRRTRRTWLNPAVAAALVVAAIGVTRPWQGQPAATGAPASSPAGTATTPSAWHPSAGEWTPTASSPLGSRYDALSFYAGGRYYVLGGYQGLTYQVLNNDQGLHGDPVLDGANYDPATNIWTPLPSLDGILPWLTASSAAVVVGDRLYVVSPLGAPGHVDSGSPPATGKRAAAVLDLKAGGGWTALPAPPATSVRTDQVAMATDRGLFLFADNGPEGSSGKYDDCVYEFATDTWRSLPRPPQRSLDSRRATVLDGTHLLLATSPSAAKNGTRIPGGSAVFDLTTRTWRVAALPSFDNLPTGTVDGIAVVETWGPKEDSPPSVSTCSIAGVAGAAADRCTTLMLTQSEARVTGGLAARLDDTGGHIVQRQLGTGTAMSVHHKLFDPRTTMLWRVPALPGVQYSASSTDGGLNGAVMAAGGGSVLSCFGYTARAEERTLVNHQECYLLPVPDPLPGVPLR